ncbi:MAG TPA: NAD(P)H-binding protein [Candidatus Dormibacteraeota bacterium]|nr:NAD(P)H-binding protein [Candidatus Dormibacteraeota bacterium]
MTGGTGTLGKLVVAELRQGGHRARILTRDPRGLVDAMKGDLATGAGLVQAVDGMEAIVHAASDTRHPWRGRATDVLGTRRLLAHARDAGVQHFVFVSIVGIDDVAYSYYRTKLMSEQVVRENIVPWTILRATQFHPFIEFLLARFSRMPGLTAVPTRWLFQPVAAGEVAQRLVSAVQGAPAGTLPDFGGPEVHDLKALAGAWLAARKSNRRIVNVPMPLRMSRAIEEGGLTCPDHKDGKVTFAQHLTEKYALP